MGRREELRKQIESLQAEYDSAEDGEELEVWVRNGDGHETRLTGERAARWLARNGYDAADADDSSAGDPLETKTTAPAKKAAPATRQSPSSSKARAAKKAAPAADVVDDGEPLPQDDAEPASGHRFFR